MTLSDQLTDAIKPVDADLFELVATGPNVPSEADLAAFEATAGFALPAAFRELLGSSLGGLYVRARPEAWPLPEAYDVMPAWRFLRGVALFGMATDLTTERLDIRFQLDEARERGVTKFVPVMTVDGSLLIWGFDEHGAIQVNDTDAETVEPSDEQDLGALYTREIAALIERQQRAAKGEGAPAS